jgi:hypothetical protein
MCKKRNRKKEAETVISDKMQCSLVDRVTSTNVSKDTTASIIFHPEDGYIRLLQNISIQLKDYSVISLDTVTLIIHWCNNLVYHAKFLRKPM